jgi:HPt (histidine-containing phosphotransfer) domain-containing protein
MPPISIARAIAAAEEQIRTLTDLYPEHAARMIHDIDTKAAEHDWDAIRVIVHDLKGQAATVGWPLLGDMARSLGDCLDSGATALFADAARLHVAAMRLCISAGNAEAAEEGERLLRDLQALASSLKRRSRKSEQ